MKKKLCSAVCAQPTEQNAYDIAAHNKNITAMKLQHENMLYNQLDNTPVCKRGDLLEIKATVERRHFVKWVERIETEGIDKDKYGYIKNIFYSVNPEKNRYILEVIVLPEPRQEVNQMLEAPRSQKRGNLLRIML